MDQERLTAETVRDLLVEAIRVVKGLDVQARPELDELSPLIADVDSLDMLEIGLVLEETLGVDLRMNEAREFATFGDVIRLVLDSPAGST